MTIVNWVISTYNWFKHFPSCIILRELCLSIWKLSCNWELDSISPWSSSVDTSIHTILLRLEYFILNLLLLLKFNCISWCKVHKRNFHSCIESGTCTKPWGSTRHYIVSGHRWSSISWNNLLLLYVLRWLVIRKSSL